MDHAQFSAPEQHMPTCQQEHDRTTCEKHQKNGIETLTGNMEKHQINERWRGQQTRNGNAEMNKNQNGRGEREGKQPQNMSDNRKMWGTNISRKSGRGGEQQQRLGFMKIWFFPD